MKINKFILLTIIPGIFLLMPGGCSRQSVPALKDVFEEAFLMGTAIDRQHLYAHDPAAATNIKRADRRGYSYQVQLIVDPRGLELTRRQFNSVTSENVLKWEEVHPRPGEYDFDAADRFVEFGEANGMFIVGHTLVWHNQTPSWVFEDDKGNLLGRDALLERMRDHIHTVVGRYRGRIHGWDVVNEAVNLDGTMRESLWYQIIGDDYITKAFKFAREADSDVDLYYNDFLLEIPSKRAGVIRLVRNLLENGAPVNGIGSQSHFHLLEFPESEDIENSIIELSELGIDVMITELDISVLPRVPAGTELTEQINPYIDGLPDSVQEELAERYREIFEIYLKHRDRISRVTFWNVTDADSRLNYLPVEGRVNHPLLFDREYKPKRAFYSVISTAKDMP
jgi:endo-1,4-beta-xylanase